MFFSELYISNTYKEVKSNGRLSLYVCRFKIIGDEKIGNDVTLGVDTTVYRSEVKDKTLIYHNEHTGKTIERYNHISPARHYFYVD